MTMIVTTLYAGMFSEIIKKKRGLIWMQVRVCSLSFESLRSFGYGDSDRTT